jgi:hypothetical protein
MRFPAHQWPAVFHFPGFDFSSILAPVQPDKLETLDDLLAQAEHYAGFCLRNGGTMSPTLFLIGADGPLMFVPASLVDASEKDAFATTARLVCIAHAATVSVMALEAWMKTATPGEKMDMTEPPSEAFDRQEVIVLMGESRDGQKQKFLPPAWLTFAEKGEQASVWMVSSLSTPESCNLSFQAESNLFQIPFWLPKQGVVLALAEDYLFENG